MTRWAAPSGFRQSGDRRTRAMAVSGTVSVVLVVLALLLPTPYVVESPGPTFNTIGEVESVPLIQIDERTTYPTAGHLDLTTVYVTGRPGGAVTLFSAFEAWLDPADTVMPAELVYPPGTTETEIQEQNAMAMDSSQEVAVAAALSQLGIDYGQELYIVEFAADSAAQDVLQKGDLLREINGISIADLETLQDELNARGGDPVEITADRGDETVTEQITPRRSSEGDYQLGVYLNSEFDFPFEIDIALNDVGGPSAGTMFALGIIDKLTEGDMTGGKFFAGTGTINAAGKVGPIGGIVQKMVGAEAAGAEVFLAPADNCGQVAGNVPDGLQVVRVETLDDAVEAVETIGADAEGADELPACQAG